MRGVGGRQAELAGGPDAERLERRELVAEVSQPAGVVDLAHGMKVFVAALDEGSLAGAARKLGKSQAAVSRGIAFLEAQGGTVVREAGPMKHGTTVIAFVTDPDGYKIEFIQKKK